MKSLAERHIDRAQRKADNAAESAMSGNNTDGRLGAAAAALGAASTALAGLTEDERERLAKEHFPDGFEAAAGDGFRSIAEDEGGALALAGIGTVNTTVVAPETALRASGTPALNGELPEASFDPSQGNLNGAAVEAASGASGSGWGSQAGNGGGNASDGPTAVNVGMKVADIEAVAAKEGVDLSSASNNEDRVRLIEEARAAKS